MRGCLKKKKKKEKASVLSFEHLYQFLKQDLVSRSQLQWKYAVERWVKKKKILFHSGSVFLPPPPPLSFYFYFLGQLYKYEDLTDNAAFD